VIVRLGIFIVKIEVGIMYYFLLLLLFREGHFVSKELSWELRKRLIRLKIERADALFNSQK
jgi:hypothetical protein